LFQVVRAAVVAALVVCLVAVIAGSAPAAPELPGLQEKVRVVATRHAQPVAKRSFADPSVVAYGGGYLAVSTGKRAPGAYSRTPVGPWRSTGPLLHHLPHWVSSPEIWAVDVAHIGKRWVLYYAARVRRLAPGARCIGVAVTRNPARGFDARGRKPLVCPAGAKARKAGDRVLGRARSLPRSGVIDPSVFTRGKHHFLLYRTQGMPATIRLVRLRHHGLRAAHHSHQLLRVPHIVENPVLVHHGRRFTLFTSQGYFGSCGYQTTWRSSRHLLHGWHTHGHRLLNRHSTRLCGPGGLDVASGRTLVFFHGWVCGRGRRCSQGHHVDLRRTSRRTLYAGLLRWHHGHPHIRFLRRAG
jgi:hypothetical protein